MRRRTMKRLANHANNQSDAITATVILAAEQLEWWMVPVIIVLVIIGSRFAGGGEGLLQVTALTWLT